MRLRSYDAGKGSEEDDEKKRRQRGSGNERRCSDALGNAGVSGVVLSWRCGDGMACK